MNEEEKRLFFGFSVDAPWPHNYPKGRLIDESCRHLTFAFLGNVKTIPHIPHPTFTLGPVGKCDEILFLSNVVASHVKWLSNGDRLSNYQRTVLDWLEQHGYRVDRRPFLPHITLARMPFDHNEWKEWFEELPCIVTGIHLYESLGNLTYKSIWELPLLPAFEEIEHTADIAFQIRGKNFDELYLHSAIAISFKFPHFLSYLDPAPISDFNQIVKRLNAMIAQCDQETGCPFKAVSYHSKMSKEPDGLIHWEMIVDV